MAGPFWMDDAQTAVELITSKLWPSETTEEAALALCEEVGEVARAIIKRSHQERNEGDRAPKDWTANLRVELAQVVIVAMKMAEREGFSLHQAISEQLDVLRDRLAEAVGVKSPATPTDESVCERCTCTKRAPHNGPCPEEADWSTEMTGEHCDCYAPIDSAPTVNVGTLANGGNWPEADAPAGPSVGSD